MYEDLGISINKLGCIMLDTETITVRNVIPEDSLYYANDPENHAYVDGIVSEKVPHVTLLYGILRSGPEMRKHVDAVLEGWSIAEVTIDHIGYFESRYEDEQYYCLVAHLAVTPELQEGNGRLRMLPHIDTFPEYKAHITLAYIKQDEALRDKYIAELNNRLAGTKLAVKGINYGD